MTALDLTIPGEVVNLLAEFGSTVTIKARAKGTDYDRVTRRNVSVEISGDVKASPLFEYSPRDIDGDNVKSGDAQAVMSATLPTGITEDLLNGSQFLKGDIGFRIVGVEKVESGDDVAAYVVQLRR